MSVDPGLLVSLIVRMLGFGISHLQSLLIGGAYTLTLYPYYTLAFPLPFNDFVVAQS